MLMVLLKSLYLVDYIQLVLIDLLYKLEEVGAFKYSLNSCLFEGENGPLRGPPGKQKYYKFEPNQYHM